MNRRTSLSTIAVIINGSAGSGHDDAMAAAAAREIRAHGARCRITLAKGGDEMIAARRARRWTTACAIVVAGGGDGTINAVASVLVGSGTPFGVLPLGTLNHFAKDMGIPLDLDAGGGQRRAAGCRKQVDVGEVNGRIFLNNSSLGLYPDIVRDREKQQRRLGRGKWLAALWATLGALRRYPFLQRAAAAGDGAGACAPHALRFHRQQRIHDARLVASASAAGSMRAGCALYVAQRPGRLGLLRLAWSALCGQAGAGARFRRAGTGEHGHRHPPQALARGHRRRSDRHGHAAALPHPAGRPERDRPCLRRMPCVPWSIYPTCISAGSTTSLLAPLARPGAPHRARCGGGVGRPDPARQERANSKQARAWLDTLPGPQIIVPGNHDISLYNVFRRFLQPLTRYKRYITRRPRSDLCRRRNRRAGREHGALADLQGRAGQQGTGGRDPAAAGAAWRRTSRASSSPTIRSTCRSATMTTTWSTARRWRCRRLPIAASMCCCRATCTPATPAIRAERYQIERLRGAGGAGRHRHLDARAR